MALELMSVAGELPMDWCREDKRMASGQPRGPGFQSGEELGEGGLLQGATARLAHHQPQHLQVLLQRWPPVYCRRDDADWHLQRTHPGQFCKLGSKLWAYVEIGLNLQCKLV